jgi:hypothetical protein
MIRKQTYPKLITAGLLGTILPLIVFTLIFPRFLAVSFQILYLSLPIVLLLCCLKISKGSITSANGVTLNNPLRLFIILMIVLLSMLLNTGQLITAFQYNAALNTTALANTLSHFYANIGLFPWSYIAVLCFIFHYAGQHTTKTNTLSSFLSARLSGMRFYVERGVAFYYSLSIFLFLCFSLGFAIVQFSIACFPTHNPVINPLYGSALGMLFILLAYFPMSKRFIKNCSKRKLGLFGMILILLVIFLGVCFVAGYLFSQNAANLEAISKKWIPLVIFHHSHMQTLYHLFQFGWWISAGPLIATLILKFSQGQSLRKTILWVLAFPFVINLLFWFPTISHATSKHLIAYAPFYQVVSFIAFITLFFGRRGHLLLHIGYFTHTPIKKIRNTDLASVWQLVGCFIGGFALTGIQAVALAETVPGVVGLLIFFQALRYCSSFHQKASKNESPRE